MQSLSLGMRHWICRKWLPTRSFRCHVLPFFKHATIFEKAISGQATVAAATQATENDDDISKELSPEPDAGIQAMFHRELEKLEKAGKERAALVKRTWSDTAFEDGEDANEATLEQYEAILAEMLTQSGGGLRDGEVLGNALDLSGAYIKNYRLDKADAMLERCAPYAEERGGAWNVRYLNNISQVRMKQARNIEALDMLYEIEFIAPFTLEEAPQFWETLYRNMSSAMRSLGREEDAAAYFMKMVEASTFLKPSLDWMDRWELGVLLVNRAYQDGRWEDFYKARDVIEDALRMHEEQEPDELILRAKVHSNLGQCYLAVEEFDDAEKHYSKAYQLFRQTAGTNSPLFGMQTWACANLRCAERRFAEALPHLGEALHVEVVREGGLSVPEMTKLANQILMALHEIGASMGSSVDSAKVDLSITRNALDILSLDPRWDRLEQKSLDYAVLCHKFTLICVSEPRHGDGGRNVPLMRRFSRRACRLLKQHTDASGDHGTEAATWLAQAEAVKRII